MITEREHVHTAACFVIVRDGIELPTRECKHEIARQAKAEHVRINARRRAWLGEKEKR